jgi:hypothetical protein
MYRFFAFASVLVMVVFGGSGSVSATEPAEHVDHPGGPVDHGGAVPLDHSVCPPEPIIHAEPAPPPDNPDAKEAADIGNDAAKGAIGIILDKLGIPKYGQIGWGILIHPVEIKPDPNPLPAAPQTTGPAVAPAPPPAAPAAPTRPSGSDIHLGPVHPFDPAKCFDGDVKIHGDQAKV